jgi:tetratricopeptide (TPR) repeat protein
MTAERWQRVRAVFDAAVELPEANIEEYLRVECAGDPELQSEVRRMLDENARKGLLDFAAVTSAETHAPAAFETGSVVSGRYRILRRLGHGGMGEVYEAEDLELKEHVALKTLLPEIASDGRMIARFKQEIQLSRKLAHPNICRVFDLARHPPEGAAGSAAFFLTMEFLPGETLAAKLRREGRLDAAEALGLLEQMAAGLDAAHDAGVIHRDFKPSNVMLVETHAGPRAVLMDFGLARRVHLSEESTATLSGQLIGTLDYMAPELFTGGDASVASDIYALGLVARKMVTGERAGQAANLEPVWAKALARALDREPTRRFASGREFIQALHSEPALVTVKLPVITRRRVVAGAAAAFPAAAALIGWHWWQELRARPSAEAEPYYQKGVEDLHAGAYFAATKALEQAVRLSPHFSLAHARLAEAWLELDLSDKAKDEMLLARRQDLSALSRADRVQVEAIDLTITREFPAAVNRYEQLLASAGGSDVEVDLGRAYEKAGKPDKATESYRWASESPGQHPAAWLRILYNRGGKATKAEDAFRQAEQLYQLSSNLEGLTEVAFERGFAATARGEYDAASGYLQKALQTSRLVGNIHQEVRTRLQLSTNAYASGDATLAEQYAREALEAARANRIENLAIRGLVNLGAVHAAKRDFDGAELQYQQALDLAKTTNSTRTKALCLLSLAVLHDRLGKADAVLREAPEALAFYHANGFTVESYQCLQAIGRAHLKLGDSGKALEVFESAQAASKKIEDGSQAANAEEDLGTVLAVLQRYPESLTHFQKELALSITAYQRGYASLHCGRMLWVLGRYDDALPMLDAADANAAKYLSLRISILLERADMALSRNQSAEASAFSRKALTMDSAQSASTSSEVSRILGLAQLSSGQLREGLRQCRNSLAAAEKLNSPSGLMRARLALLEAGVQTGDRTVALQAFHDAEADLNRFPEFRWRMLALMSRADSQYLVSARDALNVIKRAWGDKTFAEYAGRPDVSRLARPLLQAVNANHK